MRFWVFNPAFFILNPPAMRNCPVCNLPLEPVVYEGLRILRCPQCQGHLLERARLEAIQRIPEKSLAELEAEAQAGFQGDHPQGIRCPRCHRAMDQRPLAVPGFDLHVDVCCDCALAWLDGGELAMAQLAHQGSPKFRDTREQMRRAAALDADPARKAAFDAAVAKLPETPNPVVAGVGDAFCDAILQIVFGVLRPTRL